MDFVTLGRVVKPHGIDGTFRVIPLTDFPQHFKCLKEVFLIKDHITKASVQTVRSHKGHILLKVKQCSDRTSAESWIGAEVAIDSKDLWPLKEGEYYHFQIEGLRVITENGEYLGKVAEIMSTGSHDVYIVKKGKREYLLPAIKKVIKSIDLEKKQMIVHLLKGLTEL